MLDFESIVHSEIFSLAKHLQNKMPIKLSDLNDEVIKIIKQVYQALLQASERLEDIVNDDDNSELQKTFYEIEALCEEYPWLSEHAGRYWTDW